MSLPRTSCMPTIRRFRSSHRGSAGPKPVGCGLTCATSGQRPAAREVAPAVWFAYSADRKGEHPQEHLEDFRGILQADGYAGFSKIYDGGRVLEAGCWAHVRRKFVDLHELHRSPVAAQTLDRIGLFASRLASTSCCPWHLRATHAASLPGNDATPKLPP